MSKKSIYQCTNCGAQAPTWSGRCYECNQWSTLVEVPAEVGVFGAKHSTSGAVPTLQTLDAIKTKNNERQSCGIAEIDRLLGGGMVPGSVILLGGEPGIGKSTLAIQIALKIKNTLYISGEESPTQIKQRANRMTSVLPKDVSVSDTVDVMAIATLMANNQFKLIIIDSIQTMHHPDFPNTPGSPVQLRESALLITKLARKYQVPIILIGQVTKEGSVAGPRALEHIVDAMIYVEGERTFGLRMIRAVKNRYGATGAEVLKMTESGFLAEQRGLWIEEDGQACGSAVTVSILGRRPLVIEVQSLVESVSGAYPKRISPNFPPLRVDQIVAIINAHSGIKISNSDIYLNIVGGISVNDTGIDLAVALALVSARLGKPLPPKLCLIGELSLTGKIRQPHNYTERITEAKKVGFAKTLRMGYISEAIKQVFK